MGKIQDVLETLKSFETPQAIADFLLAKGVRGDEQDGESCVITNFILGETDAIGVSTTESNITIETDNYDTIEFENTPCIAAFIKQFDDGMYPDLVTDYGQYDEVYCECEACLGWVGDKDLDEGEEFLA